jgi:hypothetical protein
MSSERAVRALSGALRMTKYTIMSLLRRGMVQSQPLLCLSLGEGVVLEQMPLEKSTSCLWLVPPGGDPSLAAPKDEHLPQLSLLELVYEQDSSLCLLVLSYYERYTH